MPSNRHSAEVHEERPDFDLRYFRTKTNTWTFQPRTIRRFVEERLEGRTLNLFAGKTKLNHDDEIVRVDLDEERDADHHFDAIEVRDRFGENAFDTVVMDPPYSVIQSRKRYDGEYAGHFKHIRDEVAKVVRPGGRALTFGFTSTGMARSRGFEKEELAIFAHGGRYRDTFCVVERRFERDLAEFEGGVPSRV